MNEAAANLLKEGDVESLKKLAEENGVAEMAEAFLEGLTPCLCDAMAAAIGKLDVEAADMRAEDVMLDWAEYVKARCFEDERMAAAVRAKGKSLRGCVAEILQWSFGHQKDVDKEVLKMAGVSAHKVTMGIPGMGTAKRIITEYYLERSGA